MAAQDCQPVATPKRLPSLNQLLDSAALVAGITDGKAAGNGAIVLGLAYPERVGPPTVFGVEPSDSAEAGGDFQRQVLTHLRAKGAAPGTTLRLRLRPPADFRVERSVLCPPIPYDSTSLMRVAISSGRGGAVPVQRWKSAIRVLIGEDGSVLDARLQPASGRGNIDRLVLEPVYRGRWRPATLDGRPVKVWFANGRAELVQ
jgi:hypothetical protein